MADRLTIHKDGTACYDIVYATDLQVLRDELQRLGFLERRCCIITDTNVAPLYAERIADLIARAGDQAGRDPGSDPSDAKGNSNRPQIYAIPAGEEHKNLDEIRSLYRFLIENHYDRKSYLIALGGGVVGDMTGFAAATYLRGIDFIQIPTTLLAQADSSIGGKTGVDFEGYKNMVGAFYMPKLVFADVEFLKSLEGRQFVSGFAEIMKHALIKDEEYYSWLIDHQYEIQDKDLVVLHEMLVRSNEIKRDVVEKDPYEKKDRMLLNFGHTIGHAIEKFKDFSLTHGECVALGCVAAAFISYQKKYLSWEEYYEIRDMFVPFGLPISETALDHEEILRLTKSDKKTQDGLTRFILLRSVGDAFIDTTVTDTDILAALDEIDWDKKNVD
ncbi:3-dehydroquinate synthase [Lachnospiraceae bacterium NK3A20]|nr:3-dehydroquinate synthase [Lachnospiraceae bacterium NK3A20]